ncbi:MAG: HEAT repeat domain-containing protein, partial [Chthoniobacteraceae bacterium]
MKILLNFFILLQITLSLHAAEDPTRSTAESGGKIAAGKAGWPVSLFYSSGDAIVAYKWLPMDSSATCKASFEVLHTRYNCDRIFWREANTEWIMKWNEVRPDSPWLGDLVSDSIRINRDFKTTEHAAREARANGIAFWGIFHLFDYSGKAECGSGGNRSQGAFYGLSPWLEKHPEFCMWDRAHITFMTGGIEYGAPEVRAEYVRRVDEMFKGAWSVYAGILVYTFIENMEAHFTDEYIYSDDAVAEFKRRFGTDVRTQPFDLEQYCAMRGDYITQYLRELRPVFLKHHKKLAMTLNAENMDSPQAWLAGTAVWPKDVSVPYTVQQGRVKMDWRTWVKEGLVDELQVWGGVGPNQKCADVRAILEATKGTGIKVTVFYQTEFAAQDQDLYAQGVRRVISVEPGNEEGDSAKHMAADIDSRDDAVVLRVLAQVRAKECTVPGEKLIALLLKHANPLVCRQAASTIGTLKLADCIAALDEAAINEPEGSVKAMVFDALGKVNGPHSVAAMARGFGKMNTFPVRMALRDTLAVLGPERSADVAKSYDTQDDYFRRVLLESFTRHNGTPESLALITRALHDPNDKVRWWAANAFQYQSVKAENIEALLAALDDSSDAVQSRAAVSLVGMVRKMSDEMKQRCFDKLLARYREFDTGCQRSDAEWGWRPFGETLRDGFGNQGKDTLLAILNSGKTDLAKF